MPTQHQFISCDKNKCDGRLEYLAATAPYRGIQYGDTAERQVFQHCKKCGTIYTARCGEETGQFLASSLKEYNGRLTKEEIKLHAETVHGTWSDSKEQEIICQVRPENYFGVHVVARGTNDNGVIILPESMVGRKVKIEVINE